MDSPIELVGILTWIDAYQRSLPYFLFACNKYPEKHKQYFMMLMSDHIIWKKHRKVSQAEAHFHSGFLYCCRLGFATFTFYLGFLWYTVSVLKLEKGKEKRNSPKQTFYWFVLCEGRSQVPGWFISKFPSTYFLRQPGRHQGQISPGWLLPGAIPWGKHASW